jgi:hypothetical protein
MEMVFRQKAVICCGSDNAMQMMVWHIEGTDNGEKNYWLKTKHIIMVTTEAGQ